MGCLRCQGVETLGRSLRFSAAFHLPFPDHVHEFDAGEKDASAAKIFEAEHRSGSEFDRAVVLFDDVVQVLDLAYDDRLPALGVDVPEPHAGSRTRWESGDVIASSTTASANQSGV